MIQNISYGYINPYNSNTPLNNCFVPQTNQYSPVFDFSLQRCPSQYLEDLYPSYSTSTVTEPVYPSIPYFQPQNTFNSSMATANRTLSAFNKEFPDLESSTMMYAHLEQMKRHGASEKDIEQYSKKCEKMMDKYMDKVAMRKKDSIDDLKKYVKKANIANCGDRAYIVDDILNKSGYSDSQKKMVLINGNDDFGNHCFNVIGLKEDADITNPATWGEDAVIIDAWMGKVMKPNQAIGLYRDFLGYDYENQPMFFSEYGSSQDSKNKS